MTDYSDPILRVVHDRMAVKEAGAGPQKPARQSSAPFSLEELSAYLEENAGRLRQREDGAYEGSQPRSRTFSRTSKSNTTTWRFWSSG